MARERITVTDEEILSMQKVPAHTAARYLGIPYPRLISKLQTHKCPFGDGELKGSRWVYDIYPRRLYNFKHGIDVQQNTEITEMRNLVNMVLKKLDEIAERSCMSI